MKKILATLLLAVPFTVAAQNMNEQDMQGMMAQMQEMAACMQSIDQNELKTLETESKKFQAEVESLCASGKRDQAQSTAMVYARDVMKSPAFTTMRKCTENMQGAMQGMIPQLPYDNLDKEIDNRHVCDMR